MPPLSELQQPKHQPGTIFALVLTWSRTKLAPDSNKEDTSLHGFLWYTSGETTIASFGHPDYSPQENGMCYAILAQGK